MLNVAIIFTIFVHLTIAEKRGWSKTYEYPETQISINFREGNTNLVYARCNSSQPGLSKQCIVSMKFDASENPLRATKECVVNLKAELPEGLLDDRLSIYIFGDDKVLLLWKEVQNASVSEDLEDWTILKTSVVHVRNDCRSFERKVHQYKIGLTTNFHKQYFNTIVYNNTYELKLEEFKDNATSLSQNDTYYRLHIFDRQNHRIGVVADELNPYFKGANDYRFVKPIKYNWSEKVYLITNAKNNSFVVELIDKKINGYKIRQLWAQSYSSSFTKLRTSVINEAIGLCYICEYSNIGCWKSNLDGQIQMQTQFTLDFPHKSRLSTVYNLRDGGLLLAVTEYLNSSCNFANTLEKNQTYYLMKVDPMSNVHMVEVQFETPCYSVDNYAITRIFENKRGQYCIVRLCKRRPEKALQFMKGHFGTSVQCYSNDEFSVYSNDV